MRTRSLRRKKRKNKLPRGISYMKKEKPGFDRLAMIRLFYREEKH